MSYKCYRDGGCGPYEMIPCSECPASKEDYAMRTYDKIRQEIEETWPDWKIKVANEYITSVHGKKLRTGMQRTNERCDCCDNYRWDAEDEYEFCTLDLLKRRIPVYKPLWCPKDSKNKEVDHD